MNQRRSRRIKVRIEGNEKTFVAGPDIDLDKEVVLAAKGERITEARAEQIAEETMAEYYRRRGRPPLAGPAARGKHSPQVAFRLPEELAERAEREAARQGKSLSQLAREALQRYLDEGLAEKTPGAGEAGIAAALRGAALGWQRYRARLQGEIEMAARKALTSESLARRIEQQAAREGKSPLELEREILERYLDEAAR